MSVSYSNATGSFNLASAAGPNPRYSISMETQQKSGIAYANRYNISATGIFLATGDVTTLGARAKSVLDEVAAELIRGGGYGTLTIQAAGGSTSLIFEDCKLVSIEAAEQDDSSQGVTTQEFTATFEAYKMSQTAGSNDDLLYTNFGDGDLDDLTETWDWAITEDNTSDKAANDTARNFTASYTVSATGRGSSTTSGYETAKTWVQSRTSANSNPLSVTDLLGNSNTLDGLPGTFTPYNKITSRNEDTSAGTYSETVTWVLSKYQAACNVDISGSLDPAGAANTVDVSVTITGYEDTLEAESSAKYTNAKAFYDAKVDGNLATWAASHYNTFLAPSVSGRSLNSFITAKSISSNETDGVITVSASFDDKSIFNGAVDQNLQITDTNTDGGNEIVAILPVIAKSNGPVIQNMLTTGERTRSISLDLTMNQDNRTNKPNGLPEIAAYIPNASPVYRQNKTESWNPFTGAYNLTVDYVWTDNPITN